MKQLFAPGHRACAGCGASMAVRYVLEATGEDVIMVSPTGCLEVFSTPFPETAWNVPWIHSLFENAAAVASGVESALKAMHPESTTKVVAMGGDGSTLDIGMRSISGAFERGHDFTYICYDNEAYMNTGIQRSGSTPFDASTTTSPAGKESFGNQRPKKNMPLIMSAHGSPYVAVTSIAYPKDVIKRVKTAVETKGPTYVQIHMPCCTGWKFDGSKTVEVGKLAVDTGLWPIYDYVNGEIENVRKVKNRKPVEDYLKTQGRFKHLFTKAGGEAEIAKIQAIADWNAKHFGLE